jgi:hypothetical protein
LLNDIATDDSDAAIGQVDAVAARAAAVINARIGDGGGLGAALDLVAVIAVIEVAVVDDPRGDVADIEVVPEAIATAASVGEFRTDDADRAVGIAICQKPHLIVVERAVDDDKVAAFIARAVPRPRRRS